MDQNESTDTILYEHQSPSGGVCVIDGPRTGRIDIADRGTRRGVGPQGRILVLLFQRNAGIRAVLYLTVVGSAAATRYVEFYE